jgi:dTDP-4-amino-4,6-dideoxygalactose transaminase
MAGLNVQSEGKKILINNVGEYNRLFQEKYIENLNSLINKGNYILGDDVINFENKMAKYIGTNFCLGVSSGTSALELAFDSLGLNNDDEVIIQANAYISCAFGALKSNAKLVLIDCDKNGIFDLNEFEKNINPKTKAVLVVHLYGDCCNMNILSFICKKNNIKIIEDCAQSQGTKYNNKILGSFGDISCFSFYPSKNLGALGDGGAICTNNEYYYNKIKHLRNLGSIKKYEHEIKGTNSRLDTLQSLFLLTKFDDIDNSIQKKRHLVQNIYKKMNNRLFKHIENDDRKVYHSYHLYVLQLNDRVNREDFMNYLANDGVETIIHYKIPFYKTNAFSEFNKLTFPNTEKLSNTIVSIPIYNTMTLEQATYVTKVIEYYDMSLDYWM